MENEEMTFECSECGKRFEPDPDAMVETGLGPQWVKDEAPCGLMEEVSREEGGAILAEDLAKMDEIDLRTFGLTPESRDKLLAGEHVTTGAACICRECQDKMLDETEAQP